MFNSAIRVTVKEALQSILNSKIEYGNEEVEILQSVHRILDEPIYADRDLPPFDRVCMDGICIRSADFLSGNKVFSLKGVQAAGEEPSIALGKNEAIEIMTGAVLPSSADCVIRYEDLTIDEQKVRVNIDKLPIGKNIHPRGIDNIQGENLIESGTKIRADEISIMATVGKDRVKVKKRPRILIVSTGDELIDINESPKDFQIRRSNVYSLKVLLTPYADSAKTFHIGDDKAEIIDRLKSELDSVDILILSGGVSKGKFDFIPEALEAIGATKLFHGVNQKPGKPFWFGVIGEKRIFALPGNPVSSIVCARRYIIPFINTCVGVEPLNIQFAKLTESVHFKPSLTRYMEAFVHADSTGQLLVDPISGNGSGDFTKLLKSNALIELEAETKNFETNTIVPFFYI